MIRLPHTSYPLFKNLIHCSKISIIYAIQPINNKSQYVVTLQKYLKRYHTG